MEDHRHLTEPHTCHFTDILLGPVYAILRQSPVMPFCFHKEITLISYQMQEPITLSDNNSVKKVSCKFNVQASTATLLYLVNPFTC